MFHPNSLAHDTLEHLSRLPDEAPESPFLFIRTTLFGPATPPVPCFPRNRALIHPESPGHPRPPGVRSGTPEERKAETGPLYQRENMRTPLSRRKSPSPSPLIALLPPAPPLANSPAGCLHFAFPPPTSLYSVVHRAVCLYSAVAQLLASRLIETPGRCSSICLGGHGLGQRGGADVCRAF
jgi:hypothetical protein